MHPAGPCSPAEDLVVAPSLTRGGVQESGPQVTPRWDLRPFVGTRADLDDVFALHAAGRARVIYEPRPLSGVNEAIEEVLAGSAKARLVLHP